MAIFALVLNTEVCQTSNCKSLIFKETTGIYNATSNPGGWDNPNPATAGATAAELAITAPNGTIYTIDLFSQGFPSSTSELEFEITADLIGGVANDTIPDGIYTINYTVVDASGITYIKTLIQSFICNVECCVYSMFKSIDFSCDCSQDAKTKALDAWLLFKALQYSSGCGSTDNFNTNLATLQKLCLNANCNNCRQ